MVGDQTKISIGAALLAGGKSTRMEGSNKALLKLNGLTYLERIGGELSFFPERIYSGNSPELAEKICFKHMPDILSDKGPMGGIYTALCGCESQALFFVACDMPFFKKEMAEYLMPRYLQTYDCIMYKDFTGRIQPLCGIYGKSCIRKMEVLLEQGRLKMAELLSGLEVKIVQAPKDTFPEDAFRNVNRKEDIP